MLVIGGGCDILIDNNCSKQTNNSYTAFPTSYYGQNGVTSSTTETNNYLGGSRCFKVKEIEAFQLIFH